MRKRKKKTPIEKALERWEKALEKVSFENYAEGTILNYYPIPLSESYIYEVKNEKRGYHWLYFVKVDTGLVKIIVVDLKTLKVRTMKRFI